MRSRHSHYSKGVHRKAACNTFAYLKSAAGLGNICLGDGDFEDMCFIFELNVNAGYASKATVRRSASGAAVLCGGAPVFC